MYRLEDYQYDLPEERIAQAPTRPRDRSKLLVLERQTGETAHRRFFDLPDLLSSGDLLVINNTEVIPARLFGKKETGGKAEVLILDYPEAGDGLNGGEAMVCRCLIRSAKRPRPGMTIKFDGPFTGKVIEGKDGIYYIGFTFEGEFMDVLGRLGRIPLPPYIRRKSGIPAPEDARAYQTVYARQKGAVAAPTAGLHFTPELLGCLTKRGILIAEITLHVGYGTFLPIRCVDIREHRMHAEGYTVSDETAAMVNSARSKGSRIVAVGTTCVRTLEFISDEKGRVTSGIGRCDLFIYPGYPFKIVDAVITNFHLPQSTLLMLVSAFAGRKRILDAYQEAIRLGYRFYSFGDAMLIL